MKTYILYENGILIKNTICHIDLWRNLFSTALINGSIVNFIVDYIKNKDVLLILFHSDGDIMLNDVEYVLNENQNVDKNKKIIVGTLAQKNYHYLEDIKINYLYLPLDDDFFINGVNYYFNELNNYIIMPLWENRKAVAFWRGGVSGIKIESVRKRVIEKLLNYQYADVKYIKYNHSDWEVGKNIPEYLFGNVVDYRELLNYKIFLIIDGACISSAHMWGFASGAVPFLISNANCWFMEFLTPYVNYIPIEYDLSNLIEQIEWVRNNDLKAKKIADAALEFSIIYFSAKFQQKYLMDKIDKILAT
jgi:hypothetical protein